MVYSRATKLAVAAGSSSRMSAEQETYQRLFGAIAPRGAVNSLQSCQQATGYVAAELRTGRPSASAAVPTSRSPYGFSAASARPRLVADDVAERLHPAIADRPRS